MQRKEKRIKSAYFMIYTIGFVGMLCVVFGYFHTAGRGFVWRADGQTQHLVALAYYSEWLKQIVRTLAESGEIVIPMWDMAIGQGSDIVTTLHYYAIGDPLNLFALFVKTEKIEVLYSGLVLLRVFLAGITFSIYCFGHGNGRKATLIGSYMYCFSSFVLYNAIRHPYFINPMIYMPLMFLGIDKVYRKEKPYLFIIATGVAAASNFYFFYMLVVACVCYAVICYKKEVGRFQWKEIVCNFGKMATYAALGVLLAAVVFWPNVMMVLFTERMGVENYIPNIFDLQYYEKLFATPVSQGSAGYSNRPGVASPAMAMLLFLFIKKGKKELKTGIVILMAAFCIPWVGSFMNGFSYVSYRCSFMASFLFSYVFVVMFCELAHITKKERWILWGSALLYTIVVLQLSKVQGERLNFGLLLFLLSVCIVFLVNARFARSYLYAVLFLILVCMSIGFSAYYLYSPEKGGYVLEYVEENCAVERASNSYDSSEKSFENPSDLLKKYNKKEKLARLETYGCYDASQNSAMLQRVNGTSFYYSMINENISRFHKEMGLLQISDFEYRDLDARSYLQALNNVKYFITPISGGRKNNSVLFRDQVKSDEKYSMYEAEDNIGFAYAYDACIPRSTYESMNCVEKQEAVLQAAVVDDEKVSEKLQKHPVLFSYVKKDFTAEAGENVKIEDGKIKVLKDGGFITILFEGQENCETYILMEGFLFDAESQWQTKQKKAIEKAKKKKNTDKVRRLEKNLLYRKPVTETDIYISIDGAKESMSLKYRNPKNGFYCGIEDYLWNLGYSEKPLSRLKIAFEEKGEYSLESFGVYCQPMNDLPQKMQKMKVEGGDSFTAGVNTFSGKVTLDAEKYLCFSIPYSQGWRAYVNGEEKELLQTNTMFMSLLLEEGTHDIELKYVTPYVREGAFTSLLGWLILVAMIIINRKKEKKR